jgi:hypothetical protein
MIKSSASATPLAKANDQVVPDAMQVDGLLSVPSGIRPL